MTNSVVLKVSRKPLIVAGIMLLLAVGPIVWLYASDIDRPVIYWLMVYYPSIACGTGIISLVLAFLISNRAVVVQHGQFALVILLVACIASAFGLWIGIWGIPEHNDSVEVGNHVYYVAVSPLHDVSNFYYIYECDSLGLICTVVWGGTTCPDCTLYLAANDDRSAVNILHDAEIIATYEPSD
jgi:hypothetical protein